MLKKAELWFALTGIVASCLFLGLSSGFPPHPVSVDPGPALFPRVMFTAWIIISLIMLARSWRQEEAKPEAAPAGVNIRLAACTIAAMIVYLLLFDLGGYLLMTTVLLIYAMRISGVRSLKSLLAYSILYSLISYLIFVRMLHVPLPQGFIPL